MPLWSLASCFLYPDAKHLEIHLQPDIHTEFPFHFHSSDIMFMLVVLCLGPVGIDYGINNLLEAVVCSQKNLIDRSCFRLPQLCYCNFDLMSNSMFCLSLKYATLV